MASRGLGGRLIVHWSRIEPQRGVIDQAYLDQVDDLVTLAASYGIYSVIDMHQDAYSAFIYTTADETCPEGSTPGKGWDGAPEWATLTDGLSTCIHGERNSAPAVLAAWNHFYDNTDGIQDRFVESWRAVAQRFAGRLEVAGYDLLNEPETSRPVAELLPLYEAMLVKVIAAIQDAEAAADFQHLLFIEPTIPAGDRDLGLGLPDPERMGVAEPTSSTPPTTSPSPLISADSTEQTNSLLVGLAQSQGTALWLGEYGFWSTDPETLAVAQRFAADEDRHGLGEHGGSGASPAATRTACTEWTEPGCRTPTSPICTPLTAAPAPTLAQPRNSCGCWAVATRGWSQAHQRSGQRPTHPRAQLGAGQRRRAAIGAVDPPPTTATASPQPASTSCC